MPKAVIIAPPTPMKNWLIHILHTHSFDVMAVAKNGPEGIEQYKRTKPDLVLLDADMSERSGIGILKELLQHDPKAKVIIYSDSNDIKLIDTCAAAGAYEFIQPPHFGRLSSILAKVQ